MPPDLLCDRIEAVDFERAPQGLDGSRLQLWVCFISGNIQINSKLAAQQRVLGLTCHLGCQCPRVINLAFIVVWVVWSLVSHAFRRSYKISAL